MALIQKVEKKEVVFCGCLVAKFLQFVYSGLSVALSSSMIKIDRYMLMNPNFSSSIIHFNFI